MTGQQIVDAIKGNIGGRVTGQVGSQTVDEAAVDCLNHAQKKIVARGDIRVLERNIEIDVSTSAYQYDVPVLDADDEAIVIKNYIKLVSLRDGETCGVPLVRLTTQKRDSLFPVTNDSHQGRPSYYSIFNDQIEFYPFPDDDYTIYGRVNIHCLEYTESSLNTAQPFGPLWDEFLEAYGTGHMFLKLQQTTPSIHWKAVAKSAMESAIRALRDEPDWEPGYPIPGTSMSSPENDPFVRTDVRIRR